MKSIVLRAASPPPVHSPSKRGKCRQLHRLALSSGAAAHSAVGGALPIPPVSPCGKATGGGTVGCPPVICGGGGLLAGTTGCGSSDGFELLLQCLGGGCFAPGDEVMPAKGFGSGGIAV